MQHSSLHCPHRPSSHPERGCACLRSIRTLLQFEMSSLHSELASPCPPRRAHSEIPSSSATSKPTNVMKIQSLLNPSAAVNSTRPDTMATPSTTRATPIDSVVDPSLEPDTPSTTTALGRNTTYNSSKKTTEVAHGKVNFPAFEIDEDSICLSPAQQEELFRQHSRFNVNPSGFNKGDLVSDTTKHIPYSSEKKRFFGKTGRDGFNGRYRHHPVQNC